MRRPRSALRRSTVVPRKGDVDRNVKMPSGNGLTTASSPARGTWIEMQFIASVGFPIAVVPRKGDVDRNREVLGMGT